MVYILAPCVCDSPEEHISYQNVYMMFSLDKGHERGYFYEEDLDRLKKKYFVRIAYGKINCPICSDEGKKGLETLVEESRKIFIGSGNENS